jgi:hypothetical protein
LRRVGRPVREAVERRPQPEDDHEQHHGEGDGRDDDQDSVERNGVLLRDRGSRAFSEPVPTLRCPTGGLTAMQRGSGTRGRDWMLTEGAGTPLFLDGFAERVGRDVDARRVATALHHVHGDRNEPDGREKHERSRRAP